MCSNNASSNLRMPAELEGFLGAHIPSDALSLDDLADLLESFDLRSTLRWQAAHPPTAPPTAPSSTASPGKYAYIFMLFKI